MKGAEASGVSLEPSKIGSFLVGSFLDLVGKHIWTGSVVGCIFGGNVQTIIGKVVGVKQL